ncbi:hypothetical protein [Caulobacter sp. UC70_42]|uniref:hypothetical protein n=1 Tax=Caulobacter sp. UC70_42 TaxID=3374551 RepID=UPI003757A221
MDDDDKPAPRPLLREWQGWVACVLGSVMPTAMLTSVIQMIDGKIEPWFGPGLFIALFTLAVLAMRPWTLR